MSTQSLNNKKHIHYNIVAMAISAKTLWRFSVISGIVLAILCYLFYTGSLSAIDPDISIGIIVTNALVVGVSSLGMIYKMLSGTLRCRRACPSV